MNTTPEPGTQGGSHFDFLIVGAGISGIGAACYLRRRFAGCSFAIVEAKEDFGGTWHTHRYPGARSDSDLYTYGYSFKPWSGRSIATADEIRNYLAETIAENDLAAHIRYRHKVTQAQWCSQQKRWTLHLTRTDTGQTLTLSANFLWMCQGYYQHEQGYTPQWPGFADFGGTVIHPQRWPEGEDCAGQRVLVIGSGATAATLIPALAQTAQHITMLQRSPTFYFAEPWAHELEGPLRALEIPDAWVHEIMRRAHIARSAEVVRLSFEEPETLRQALLEQARARLPEGFDIDKHFNPRYRPWQQRIALLPDGDLFTAIREGKASVVTDQIDHFDARGVVLASGQRLDADVLITATGFNLCLFGGVQFSVDGQVLNLREHVTWRGLMMEGVPNMAFMMGYLRSSWTLRVDLVCDLVCRIIEHMRAQGMHVVTPRLRAEDADMARLPWSDPDNFNAGYILRSQHLMFRQGDRAPWQQGIEYTQERTLLPAVQPHESALAYA